MSRPNRQNELPGYRRPPKPEGFSRNQYPPKPPQYNTSRNQSYEPDHFHFTSQDTDRSSYPRGQRGYPSQNFASTLPSSNMMSSMESDQNYRRPPPYQMSHKYPQQVTDDPSRGTTGSEHSSMYSTSSYDSQEDYQSRFPKRPPKPKYLQGQTSNSTMPTRTSGTTFFTDTTDSMNRLTSGYTDTTDTTDATLTADETPDLADLANYFNKKLDDIKRRTDTVVGDIIKGKRSQVGQQQPSNGPGLRPSNRAGVLSAITSNQSSVPSSRLKSSTSLATESGLVAVRDEIENLKEQIKRGLTHFREGQDNADMEEMATFFSKRLEDCQRQVTDAVSKVQSHVGEIKKNYDPRSQTSRGRLQTRSGDVPPYGFHDGGVRGLTRPSVRPGTRAKNGQLLATDSTMTDQSYPSIPSRDQSTITNQSRQPPNIRRRREAEPIEIDTHPSTVNSDVTVIQKPPSVREKPPQMKRDYLPREQVEVGEDDYLMLGSDAEDHWDDFEEFIDDDTPAPETSIPVPQIRWKGNNYFYQFVYIMYIISFLAYVYVRINYTLDAPGLNRIYCIVVAVLEIITAPSLIMQGMCLWRWVSREPPADDAYLRIRFHTARIMVPTYKEPLEVVAGTIHEIVHMDLPPNFHIHVYVLDDGKREVLENWVLSKRTKRRVFLHYVARPKLPGVPHHAKAGNINHTLHYVFDDAYAEKECVIIFDADFMPRRNYLLQVLPVFSEKRTRPLGLVQTPQFFYNVNPDEDVWDHLNVSFFHRIEPSLDRWSAVNCCGTNFTVRADALKDVGYFPVGCLTEDTLLSLRLCTMGWGVAYHHEVLAVGQSPHELTEIFKQRSRWCKGNLQIFLDEFPLMQSGLSLSQRVFYSSCGFNYFCASLSIPFFQLVPAWAIFFGLWPVSKIGLEFAFAFFIYYLLGNLLLLFPPPGFGIKDMWNGELASTNLWFTYFNGVRRIVGTKLMKGKGELTFKTTKKKTDDDDEGSNVGFQKEDLKACYVHFIMFFIMLITIVYAIILAIIGTDVKFYYYYMYMIGMSWALINMTPYLIVVIYCWYRVRIPGLMVACFRNVQLLLRIVCAVLILVQAFTTRNLTENFVCPHDYTGILGNSPLSLTKLPDSRSNLEVTRNSFWVLGLKDDFYTIQQVKQTACQEDEIPIITVFMHPSTGLQMDGNAGHYMPDERLESWEEYDERLQELAEYLSDVPSLIVLEPALLMHTFNSATNYHNAEYQIAFVERIKMATMLFPKSWIYVDAGNALYLQWNVNIKHVTDLLKRMPDTMRGFSINVGSFVNTTYNEMLANSMFCETGFHYIIDTSRNGGELSDMSLEEINTCTYDPPYVMNGTTPQWGLGSKVKHIKHKGGASIASPEQATPQPDYDYQKRKKRWSFPEDSMGGGGNAGGGAVLQPGGGAVAYDYGDNAQPSYDDYAEESYIYENDLNFECVTEDGEQGLDAYAWVKTPGEADGRLFPSGEFHPCLQGHQQGCTEMCPQFVPKVEGKFQRLKSCECQDPKRSSP